MYPKDKYMFNSFSLPIELIGFNNISRENPFLSLSKTLFLLLAANRTPELKTNMLLKQNIISLCFEAYTIKKRHNLAQNNIKITYYFLRFFFKYPKTSNLAFIFNCPFGVLRIRFVNYTICQLLIYFSIKLINAIYLEN
jgi:hypothetical protein